MKTPIRRLDSLTHNDTAATKLINDNFEALQQGVEDALSRSGKKPNFMDDVLDMNMHRIINIADPVDDYDLANKHYVDTKVAEEEAARIAGDNALRQLIDDEKTARIAGDNALRDAIDSGIALTPIILDQVWLENTSDEPVSDILVDLTNDYGVTYDANKSYIPVVVIYTPEFAQYISYVRVVKQSTGYKLDVHTPHNVYIPASLNSNSSVVLIPVNSVADEIYYYGAVNNCGSGGGSGEQPKQVATRFPTFSGTTTAYIDVSDLYTDDNQYSPIVTTNGADAVAGSSIAEARKNLNSRCDYDSVNKRIVLTYTDNSYVQANNFAYSFILLPVQTGTSVYVAGITDGLNGYLDNAQTTNNLVTSISSSSTDTQYPSAKCVYDIVGNIETLLQSI